jgi:transposase-like protein
MLADLARHFQISPGQITAWKQRFLEHATELFATGQDHAESSRERITEPHTKIGQLTIDEAFAG